MRLHIPAIIVSILYISSLAQADLKLVENGHSPYVIVLAPDASAADTRGLGIFSFILREMSGADLPILAENDGLPAHAIVVGRSKHLDELGVKLDPSLGVEGFVIKTVGDKIVIAGPGRRGTMYGCDTFLEKLGVRFLTPKVTHSAQVAQRRRAKLSTIPKRRRSNIASRFSPKHSTRIGRRDSRPTAPFEARRHHRRQDHLLPVRPHAR